MSQYAALDCNAASCVDIITRHHANCYTRPLTLSYGIRNLNRMSHYQSSWPCTELHYWHGSLTLVLRLG